MKQSKRKTSKRWLGVGMTLSFVALFACIYQGLETAAVGITVMIPAIFTAYVGVGHMDFKQVLRNHV